MGLEGGRLAGEMYHKRKSTQLSGKDYDKRHDFFCCPLTPREKERYLLAPQLLRLVFQREQE